MIADSSLLAKNLEVADGRGAIVAFILSSTVSRFFGTTIPAGSDRNTVVPKNSSAELGQGSGSADQDHWAERRRRINIRRGMTEKPPPTIPNTNCGIQSCQKESMWAFSGRSSW
jgi:hypothetical protein